MAENSIWQVLGSDRQHLTPLQRTTVLRKCSFGADGTLLIILRKTVIFNHHFFEPRPYDLDQGVDLQDQVTTPPKVESINLLDVLILSVKEMENVVFKIEFLLEIC